MNRRLIIRPEAETDIINGALWHGSREPGVGLELIAEVNSAILRLVKILTRLLLFAKIPSFVVLSLDDFRIAFSSLFGTMRSSFLP